MFQFTDIYWIWRGISHPFTSSSFHGMKFPAISRPLDFGDQAAHGARNEQAAAEPGAGSSVEMSGLLFILWSYNIM